MGRDVPLGAAALVLAAALAGCVAPDPSDDARSPPEAFLGMRVRVTDAASGAATPGARVTLLAGGVPVIVASSNATGDVQLPWPSPGDALVVEANGYEPAARPVAKSMDVALGTGPSSPEPVGLAVAKRVDLGSKSYVLPNACAAEDREPPFDCGLSEPSVEVAGDGTLYATGVCCVGGSPPIWLSRDDGATWSELATPMELRETWGVEGDLAIDANGDVVWVDIDVAHTQTAAWDAQGRSRHVTHHASFLGIQDRPWVRAEGEGVVYYAYNNGDGVGGQVYKSTDGGATFGPVPLRTTPYGFPNVALRAPGELWTVGVDGDLLLADHTRNGGARWEPTETVRRIPDTHGTFGFVAAAADDAGNVYVAWDEGNATAGYAVFVANRWPDGSWSRPRQVSPEFGSHVMPWIAAGGDGKVAVAWYGYDDPEMDPADIKDEPLFVYWAVSLDAASARPHYQVAKADETPVLEGPMQRRLLDFLQVEIGPRGEVHLVYAHVPTGNAVETTVYAQSARNLPLASGAYAAGPHAPLDAASQGASGVPLLASVK